MSLASFDEVRRLAEWTPPMGVVSIYLRLDPGDRGGGWRTELRNGLSAVADHADGLDREVSGALRSTVKRIEERFANHEQGLPRGEIGFVEVAAKAGSESWWSSPLAPPSAPTASFGERALVAPLACMLERGSPRGVAILSAERVRLLEWELGRLEELHSWELSVFSGDWRERKAPRVANPARAQGVSTSGRDQYDERLEENRGRFLGECGRLAAQEAHSRGWAQLVLFGAHEHRRELRQGIASSQLTIQEGDDADLISEPTGALEGPVAEAIDRLSATRERELAASVVEEARGGTRGTAGVQETEAALAEGRVERLVVDSGRAPGLEALVRDALGSGAAVTGVSGEAAQALAEVGGVAALLRY